MTKQSGLGDNLYVSGYDISGDVQSVNISAPMKSIVVTDITQSGVSRLGGQRDGQMGFVVYFDPTTAHPVLATLPTTDILATYCRGTAAGNPAACEVGKQINYDPKRGNDGSLTVDVSVQGSGYGVEWGVQVQPIQTVSAAVTGGSGVDLVASTSFGWQAYLHVMSVAPTGQGITVKLQDSADQSTWADLSGGAFTVVNAPGPGWQRLQSAGSTDTVRRYVRALASGSYTSATYAVVFVKNQTAVTF